MTFYIKFINLPGVYCKVVASTITKAMKEIKLHRDDGVAFLPNQTAVSFKDYEEQSLQLVNPIDIAQHEIATGVSGIHGGKFEYKVRKQDNLESLRELFAAQGIPGASKGNIFSLGGHERSFCIPKKVSGLKTWLRENYPELNDSLDQLDSKRTNLFPLFIFTTKPCKDRDKQLAIQYKNASPKQ